MIQNQNAGFGTSKTSGNCYKETGMGFATALPKPDGMKVWQNNDSNLNRVLSALNAGNINSLKNGDKIIVEPLYDVRLQRIYHSVTPTEIALYGKYILGVNSDGGSSSNSESWGFISVYVNRHYPNALYTPDGQGLWGAASTLSKRATFHTIINKGYGAGIAYTETRPDFTPALGVNVCEAWKGAKSNRSFHYGHSNGSAFANYAYAKGYPVQGDPVWFTVNFPAEKENVYVRQSVRLRGGSWTARNVYSKSGTWFDVALPPTTADSNRSSYIIEAKVDWIESNGSVKRNGAVKTFYIPVRPKINRFQVALTDITGKTAAAGGAAGYSGSVYAGQQVYPKYTFTSSNAWTSYNNLYGYLHEWKNGAWQTAGRGADMSAAGVGLNKSSAYARYSSLYPYQVSDNSKNTNGGNRIPFKLTSAWTGDPGRTLETTWIDIPVVKADVELLDIRLIREDGFYVTGNLWVKEKVTPQYIYKNNTGCTVYVEGYHSDKSRISGTYAIPPRGQVAVNGKQMTVGSADTFSVWGGVYLDGAGRGNTSWETNGFNNAKTKFWSVRNSLSIQCVQPNSAYREGVQVISSFKAVNAANDVEFIPSDKATVKIKAMKGATVLYTASKPVSVPERNENLAYFKWKIPAGLNNARIKVTGEIWYGGKRIDSSTMEVQTEKRLDSQTPATQFESKKPGNWSMPPVPAADTKSTTWSEWVYVNGAFQRKTYGVGIAKEAVAVTPDTQSPSAKLTNGVWSMKSGYGFTVSYAPRLTARSGTAYPPSAQLTQAQSGHMTFPEFNHSAAPDNYRLLQAMDGGRFSFRENPDAGNRRVHFIPLWYPNGTKNYTASCYFYDVWTPAGMLSARLNTGSFSIVGSLYDDHYVGGD